MPILGFKGALLHCLLKLEAMAPLPPPVSTSLCRMVSTHIVGYPITRDETMPNPKVPAFTLQHTSVYLNPNYLSIGGG